jgi:hypothetical protein
VGGVNDLEKIEISTQAAAADGLAVATGEWQRRKADGRADPVKGRPRPDGVPWISETQEVFRRDGLNEEGVLRWIYVRTREQMCCAQYVKKLKRHCQNPAEEHKKFCVVHRDGEGRVPAP